MNADTVDQVVEDAAYRAWTLRLAFPEQEVPDVAGTVMAAEPNLTVTQVAQVLRHGGSHPVFPALSAYQMRNALGNPPFPPLSAAQTRDILLGAGYTDQDIDAPPPTTDWPSFGFNARCNPAEYVLSPASVPHLTPAWRTGLGFSGATYSSPAVVDGVVYIGSTRPGGVLQALDGGTGALLWSFDGPPGHLVLASPAVAGGIVYIAADALYAVDTGTGTQRWRFPAAGSTAPAVAGGVVHVSSDDGSTYALDAPTGQRRWSVTTGTRYSAAASALTVVDGVVYVSSQSGTQALDAVTGSVRWHVPVPSDESPAVVDDTVYVATGSVDPGRQAPSGLHALDARTGSVRWQNQRVGLVTSSPALAGGVVYVQSQSGFVYALNARTGGQIWSSGMETVPRTAPAVANGVVYVSGLDGRLCALDARTGTQLWDAATGQPIRCSPAVSNAMVVVGSDDGYAHAFRPAASG
jgi:glucose dehydrogenase